MRLVPDRIEVVVDDESAAAPFSSTVEVGSVTVEVQPGDGWSTWCWSVANRGDRPVRVRSVSLVFRADGFRGPLRLFRNGYQSWSPSGVATLGVDADPSSRAGFEFIQAVHHADQRQARDGELRSEWMTVIADAAGPPVVLGFDGGDRHDGTWRLRGADGAAELWAEAFLGEAQLDPGSARSLHDVHEGNRDEPLPVQLDAWAAEVGRRGGARVGAPYQVGWCSWYHYFHEVDEDAFRSNLARSAGWPFEVFQLDDGYQAAIGDWLHTNDKFPSDLDVLADAVVAQGRVPGIWLAPFLAAPDSSVATRHPGWLAGHPGGRRLRAWWNPTWGGGDEGFMNALDTTHPEVLDHLERLAADIVGAGYRYLKLDFTFAPSLEGRWHDPTMTPAERVRAGYEAVRRGAGDDVFVLGCGVPLSNVVGLVDGNRIGQDVAPLWDLPPDHEIIPGYRGTEPSTRAALGNTSARCFMHRRLWLNDPDCIMLRTTETALSAEAARSWALAVGLSGGMAIVSDDLALLGEPERALLEEAVTLGRDVDAAVRNGARVSCPDLMEHAVPGALEAAGRRLEVEPQDGRSRLTAI